MSGTGVSTLTDSWEAGAEAARAALDELSGQTAALVLVHTARIHDAQAVVAGVRSVTGSAEVAGATCDHAFVDGRIDHSGNTVMVAVITAGPYRIGVAWAPIAEDDDGFESAMIATRAARDRAAAQLPHAAAIVYGDGHVHRHQRTLAGVHRVAGSRVPLIGGGASDSRRRRSSVLIHNDAVIDSGVLVVWIASPVPLTVAVRHGWTPIGLPCLVTHSEGTAILEIEGRPPLEVIKRFLPGVDVTRHIRGEGGTGIDVDRTFALGLIEPGGTQLVRVIYLDARGVLHSLTPLPSYSAIQVVTSNPEAFLDAAEDVASTAVTARPAGMIFAVSCIDRISILGKRAEEETRRLHDAGGGAHTFGMFTYGEFARISSVTGYHNATIVALAL